MRASAPCAEPVTRRRRWRVAVAAPQVGVWLWETAGGCVVGGALGAAAARVLRWSLVRGLMEKESLLGYTVTLSLAVVRTAPSL